MYRLKEVPAVRAMKFLDAPVSSFLKALHEPVDGLAVRAAIFRTIDQTPRLLLLKRAESDSLPGRWELPGGGVEVSDACVKDAIYREIKEETGLSAAWLVQEVGSGQRWTNSRGQRLLAVTFVVEVKEIERLESPPPKATTPITVDPDFSEIPIKLTPSEHQEWSFFTEQQIRAKANHSGQPCEFTSDEAYGVVLEAFELQKVVVAEKSRLWESEAPV